MLQVFDESGDIVAIEGIGRNERNRISENLSPAEVADRGRGWNPPISEVVLSSAGVLDSALTEKWEKHGIDPSALGVLTNATESNSTELLKSSDLPTPNEAMAALLDGVSKLKQLRVELDDVADADFEVRQAKVSSFVGGLAVFFDESVRFQSQPDGNSSLNPVHAMLYEQNSQDILASEAQLILVREQLNAGNVVPASVLDHIYSGVVKIGLRALIGAVVGGPAGLILLSEPIIGGIVEGALGGVAVGAAMDVQARRKDMPPATPGIMSIPVPNFASENWTGGDIEPFQYEAADGFAQSADVDEDIVRSWSEESLVEKKSSEAQISRLDDSYEER